ncbi:MAG: glycosyltransferase family 2 protein [Ilumatobacteraceae bacterium]|jgi:glycosyltransferase involved in cell wall biosynthesis|nr:glycosyltransferase family 2 protein [Ilumatobacteraceae bacterium]
MNPHSDKNPCTLAVVILTYNEEYNISQALDSVMVWANEIFILDSLSTDRTLEIARSYGCHIAQNKFEDYAKQRNHALDNLPITSEWVLFLDADEWLSESLKHEIKSLIATSPAENGYYINRRFVWMGRWIRRGYYPSWILRLFRYGKGRCEDRAVNEHLIVEGVTGHLKNDFTDENRKGVSDWIAKHNGYATREALELLNTRTAPGYQEIDARLFGTQAQRRRWLRYKVWNSMPPLIRPFFYFFYRYVLRGGFLDGQAAFIYHFLQALWYPLLIDVKYLEMKMSRSSDRGSSR